MLVIHYRTPQMQKRQVPGKSKFMQKNYKELRADELRRVCDPAIFHFKTTAELPVLTEIIGQESAVRRSRKREKVNHRKE